ncbi:MAG TPA: molecular chaperone HtpG [Magnetospirillaceae bacterium]|jgi:molecular chaperone HtpG
MAEEKRVFQAEVSKLLEIVVNSLYSEKEVFLRELISNASDACDRLRYAALTEPSLTEGGADFRIVITPDKTARTLTIADNGIGMTHDELIENLGTIARSGTSAFLSQLSGDARKDVALIGQFGVGFYSAFMVAEKVDVITRKAGETQGWRWTSDGKGEFTVNPDESAQRGARIVLQLRAGEDEFLEPYRLQTIVKTYSDHIALPVVLVEDGKEETVNSASALWTRPRNEITEEQYKEFYRHSGHAFDDPWLTIHYKAEGAIEYTGLLFVPSSKPFDLFDPGRKQHVRLYVRRVFITGDTEGLLPPYLRFVRGVVDSQDLPLNVSREMLQTSPVLAKMRTGLVKRVLGDLKKKADDAADDYLTTFWPNFGAVLKEGIYEDFERRDDLLDLCRFATTVGDKLTSLADYVSRMKSGQDAIYTISGDDVAALRNSPQLEGFIAKGVEVLLLSDPIDEFWPQAVSAYKEKSFKSVNQAGADLSKIEAPADADQKPETPATDIAPLIEAVKTALGEAVKDVRASARLTTSAVCLVADDGDMSIHLERLLRKNRGTDPGKATRILELNPTHPLITRLAGLAKDGGDKVTDAAWLLFDQARVVEGEPPSDPAAFARRLAAALERAF